MKRYCLLFITLFIYSLVFSQTPGVRSSRVFGGSFKENGRILKPTPDGGYLTVGQSNGNNGDVTTNHGREDIWVIKFNASGGMEWQKSFGGSGSDLLKDVLQFKDGSFTLIAVTQSANGDVAGYHGNADIWAVHINPSGSVLWQRSLGGSGAEEFRYAATTVDDGCIITGYTLSNDGDVSGNHGGEDIWVVKLSSSGGVQWQRCLGGTGSERPRFVLPMEDGNYVVVGSTASTNGDVTSLHGNNDLWVVKLNSTGTILWQKTYGGTRSDTGFRALLADDGNLVVLANTTSNDRDVVGRPIASDFADAWVVKIRYSDGALQWQKCVGGSLGETPVSMIKNADGSYLLLCTTESNDGDAIGKHGPHIYTDILLTRISTSGNVVWSQCFGGSKRESLFDLFHDATNQSYILCAATESSDGDVQGFHPSKPGWDTTNTDGWILKVSYQGKLQWQRSLGGSRYDYLYSLQQTATKEWLLLGETESADGDIRQQRGNGDLWLVNLGAGNVVKGTLFLDRDLNGLKGPDEPLFSDAVITTQKDGDSVRSVPFNGFFLHDVDTGNYRTTVTFSQPYFTALPAVSSSSFPAYYMVDSFAIAVQPIANKNDLAVALIPQGVARPGFEMSYQLFYKNTGTTIIPSGEILLRIDPRLDVLGTWPDAYSVASDTLKWKYTNLWPLDSAFIIIRLRVKVPPLVNLGDTLSSAAVISPSAGDETPQDNTATLKQVVVGSFDPNDKMESNGGSVDLSFITDGKPLTYVVRFQNMGTDTAFTVIIRDTLDTQLDMGTLQVVKASHPGGRLTIVKGRFLSWKFEDIKLPPKSTNDLASQGYVVYQIKPLRSVGVGSTIHNTASIYFDYNLPVKTNDASTVVVQNAKILPTVTITKTPAGATCQGVPVKFTAVVAPNEGTSRTYQWKVNGIVTGENAPEYATANLKNGDVVGCTLTGTFSGHPVSVSSNEMVVAVHPKPAVPTITAAGNVLTSSVAEGNQWYLNGIAISGATGQTHRVQASGTYTVGVVQNGCSATSEAFQFVSTGIVSPIAWDGAVRIYPNPVEEELLIRNNGLRKLHLQLIDVTGKRVYESSLFSFSGAINVQGLTSGVYQLLVTDIVKKETMIVTVVKR